MQPTSSIGGTGDQTRTFKQSIVPKILGTLVTVFFLGLLALLFIPKWLPVTMTQGMRVGVALGVVAIVAIIALVILVLGMTRVVVSPSTVEVRNPMRVLHTLPRQSTYFSTHVLKRTTNGIPSGTERSLVAHRDGETIKIALGTMSRKNFNELYALLDSTQQQAANAVASQAEDEARRFAKPDGSTLGARTPQGFAPRTFTAANLSDARRGTGIVILIVGLLAAVGGFVLGTTGEDPELFFFLGGLGGIVAFLGLLIVVIAAMNGGGAKTIEVSSQGVAIDGQVYPYAGMSRLWLTPPTYANRRMRLVATGGTTKSVSFGKGVGKPEKQRFPDWPDIVDAVQRSAAAYPGLVALDLE